MVHVIYEYVEPAASWFFVHNVLKIDEKTINVGTDNCECLKKEGHILMKAPEYGSMPIQEIAMKLKETKENIKVIPVGEIHGDSDWQGCK